MGKPTIHRQTIFKDPDNLGVWFRLESSADAGSNADKLNLLNSEIQSICNEYISTLDDTLHKKSPRPNPTPRIFIEQGNELSRILWLRWEP